MNVNKKVDNDMRFVSLIVGMMKYDFKIIIVINIYYIVLVIKW